MHTSLQSQIYLSMLLQVGMAAHADIYRNVDLAVVIDHVGSTAVIG